jgi:hypothetical protein
MLKKSQIKMFETIAILVIFFILLMFGFIFYTRIQKGTFEAEQEEVTVLKSVETSQKISFLPEIQCSRDNIEEKDCIDLLKLEKAGEVITLNIADYFNIFGYSNTYVKEIYPEENEYLLYDFPRKENRGKISTQFPVSLYNPQTDTYAFGVLFVDIYR